MVRQMMVPALLGLAACSGVSTDDVTVVPTGETAMTSPTGTTGDALDPSVDALVDSLANAGIAAAEGKLRWDLNDGCCIIGDCRLANEGSAYAFPALPPGEGEYIADRFPDPDGDIAAWRLRPDEGVLYVGPRPPGVTYASMRSYVHDRDPGDGSRVDLYMNLGDTQNDLTITANRDGTWIVLSTGHAGLVDDVRKVAAAIGWPELAVDVMPSDLVRFGLNREADSMHLTVRMVGTSDADALAAYRDRGTGRVFRLTPDEERGADPIDPGPLREAVAQPPLTGFLQQFELLKLAIIARHPGWSVIETAPIPSQPPASVPEGEARCWAGCNRDLSYEGSVTANFGPRDRLWVFGIDPARLGRSAWTELMLGGAFQNDAAAHAGSDDLVGSAQALDPALTDESLFAWVFSRDCTGLEPYCSELVAECPGLDIGEPSQVLIRHYLDLETGAFPPLQGLGLRGYFKINPPPDTTTTMPKPSPKPVPKPTP